MASDPVLLEILSSVCHEELQLFERVSVVYVGKDGLEVNLCIGKHYLFFVSREMERLVMGKKLAYLDIEKAITDSITGSFFILELTAARHSAAWPVNRILIRSEHREKLIDRIALCWQAEVMYRLFDVRKFQQAKMNMGEQLSEELLLQSQAELVQVSPFNGYEDSFKYRGYSFHLRQGFKSISGLKDGSFLHPEGWSVSYNSKSVVVPPGVQVMFHVENEKMIMDLDNSSTGDDLKAIAVEYQKSITEHLDQFYIVASNQYMKRMNRNNDMAAWDGWEFFIRSKEYAFACVFFRRSYIPPLCSTFQDVAVVLRCPANGLTSEVCEVILDECRFVADTLASVAHAKTLYRSMVQARLDALQFNEDGYRWAEGHLGLTPKHKRPAAAKFVKSIVKILVSDGLIWDETIEDAEVFRGIQALNEPLGVTEEVLTDAEALLTSPFGTGTREERRNSLEWRVARYFAYCLDGGMLGDRLTFAHLARALGRGASDTDANLRAVVDWLMHVRPRNAWTKFSAKLGVMSLLHDPELFSTYDFNERILRTLLSEGFIASEWKKRRATGSQYEELLGNLLVNEHVGLSLQTIVSRLILDMTTNSHEEEKDDGDSDEMNKKLLPALLKVLAGNNTNLKSYATASLVNMSCGKESMKTLLVSEGVLKLCIKQLKLKDDDLTLYTLYLLVNLTKSPHHRHIVTKEGGVPVLVDILTSSYQNIRKQKILTEVASVLGQLCNDQTTRAFISGNFPVVPCLLWVNDAAEPNTKLKSKLFFCIRQLCMLNQNKIKVGQHIIPVLMEELSLITSSREECATNLILLLQSLASVNANAVLMQDQIDTSLESSGIQKDGAKANTRLAKNLWPKVEELKARIQDAVFAAE